ncbi:MAG: CRISPR-associated endonuclease Cas1 [Anaerolineae bacterium]
MPTLYVTEQGARVEKEYRRLLVTKEDEVLFRAPLEKVSQVVLVGYVGLTTPAMLALLHAQVPVLLVKRTGALVGRLVPETPKNLPLRQAQYARDEDARFALAMARSIVAGKLRNQRVLALRILRRRPEADRAPLPQLYAAEAQVPAADTQDQLLGVEGAGARAYLAIYRQAFDPGWGFDARTRRPPRDPINALLSLGYTLLGHAMMTALEAVGLDPYLGYFHAEKYGRPALALDLVEEFRAPFVDSLVMRLVGWGMLKMDDFMPSGDGIYLGDKGLRVFLRAFGNRLASQVRLKGTQRSLSYRKHFEVQARQLSHVILDEKDEYEPFWAR